jgi:hypothetical protein
MIARSDVARLRPYWQVFLYLQVLDVLTTLVGIHAGLHGLSPFIRHLAHIDPAVGLALSKCIAFALAALSLVLQRSHLIRWINYWYAALLVWNLWLILRAPAG